MNLALRLVLLGVSLLTAIFVIRKIRKAQFAVQDTLFWLFFCLLLVFLAVFPQAVYALSALIGFASPSNFIFVMIIFLLMVKIFLLSVKVAGLESKLSRFAQKYALDREEEKKDE